MEEARSLRSVENDSPIAWFLVTTRQLKQRIHLDYSQQAASQKGEGNNSEGQEV